MLFKKNKRDEASKELELLYETNIRTGCRPDTKENVIQELGRMLADTGYVKQDYVEGMLKREESFSTYMGNELALPHGVEEVKKEIRASGIAVMIFPEGTNWGSETVKIVIGIAGAGEEHLNILSVIAEKVLDEKAFQMLVNGTQREVYEILKAEK